MKKTNESGRSMVEMLGVLAIVGVLSVGGLAGYTTAMNKYRQTELTNTMSLTLVAAESEGTEVEYTDKYGTIPSAIKTMVTKVKVDPAKHEIKLTEAKSGIKCGIGEKDSGPCKDALTAASKSGSFEGYTFLVGETPFNAKKND